MTAAGSILNVGSIPAGQEPDGHVTLIVVGLHQLCWRCDQMTVCVVGFTRPGRLSVSEVVQAEDEGLLSWAAQLVPEDVRRREQVGVIKARFSRTAERSYVSNGCFHCDALQGAVPLGQSFLAQAAAWGDTVKRMPAVHQVHLPVGWWEQLLRDHPVRPLTQADFPEWPFDDGQEITPGLTIREIPPGRWPY